MHAVIVDKELIAKPGDRDQAIGARLFKTHEQAKSRDAGNAACKLCSDPIGQEGGHVAVCGIALSGHGPALSKGDLFSRIFDMGDIPVCNAVVTQT